MRALITKTLRGERKAAISATAQRLGPSIGGKSRAGSARSGKIEFTD